MPWNHPKKTEGLLSNVLNIGNHCQNSLPHFVCTCPVQNITSRLRTLRDLVQRLQKIKNAQNIHVVSWIRTDSSVFHTMWLLAITASITFWLWYSAPHPFFFTYDRAMQNRHCQKSLRNSDVTCSMVHRPVFQIIALYKKSLGKERKRTCPAASSHPVCQSTGITQCMQLLLNNSLYAYTEKGIMQITGKQLPFIMLMLTGKELWGYVVCSNTFTLGNMNTAFVGEYLYM